MSQEIEKPSRGRHSPFEQIKRTNEAGLEFWSSRDFAEVLGYDDYRNFERVVEKAKLARFNSGHRIEDHFVDVTEMVTIGSGAERPVKTILLSRYACYLTIQNADPKKAFEFGMWISAEFKIYLIKEFQRLKDEEQRQLGWDIRRNLAKINYRILSAASGRNQTNFGLQIA
ncbi:MAG: BRO family protein, partial [bacterium]|nr:BRO family protein [bacterium]